MSKAVRPPWRSTEPAAKAEPAKAPEGALEEQSVLGNQALAAQLDAPAPTSAERAPAEAARAEALSLVERGLLALTVEPRPAGRIERFTSVIEASRLPAERKSVLIEKLVGDQEAALAVERAAERWLGGAGEDARVAAMAALDGVWGALVSGGPSEMGWSADGREVAVDGESASEPGAYADRLIAALAEGQSAGGEGIRGFCREVYLIVAWRDEDEEELSEPGELPAVE